MIENSIRIKDNNIHLCFFYLKHEVLPKIFYNFATELNILKFYDQDKSYKSRISRER